MRNEFKKLLLKELGDKSYTQYFGCYKRLIEEKKYDSRKLDNKEIFDDIYGMLKGRDVKELAVRFERLMETLYASMQITRHYVFNFIFYLAACFFLIWINLEPAVTMGAMVLMGACFIYKTFQFVINKYCFIDAHIILVYKAVLDVLLVKQKPRVQ